jgi:hypothetical protein
MGDPTDRPYNFYFMTNNKKKYTRTIEISLIISLIIFILLFFFFPRFNLTPDLAHQYQIPGIEVIHIPLTTQKANKKPRPNKPVIPVEAEVINVLEYVEIENIVEGDSSSIEMSSGPVSYTDLPYTPRQLFDVLPEKNDDSISGSIILSLRIGIDGEVKEYKVAKNTTGCNPCLENVIMAVQQSKWEPALVNNQKVEYWIDKTYQF